MSNQLELAAEEETWINRMSRFMSVHIKENGPGVLPHIPFIASQPVADHHHHQQKHPCLTHKELTVASSDDPHAQAHFSINESLPAVTKDNGQMTIFYGGQVIVLNLSTKKAEAIIRVASKASSFVPASSTPANVAIGALDLTETKSTRTFGDSASGIAQANRQQVRSNAVDLPIQRKASLSLFFEKRKNRINARAPYNVKGEEESSKSADGKPWLALAAPDSQFS